MIVLDFKSETIQVERIPGCEISDRMEQSVRKLITLFAVFCLPAVLCVQGVCASQEAEVRVDLSQPGKKVSPNQFGIFFEEINHAGDGGLYAELIRNGSVVGLRKRASRCLLNDRIGVNPQSAEPTFHRTIYQPRRGR